MSLYNLGKYQIAAQQLNWNTDVFRVMLVNDLYIFNADQQYVSSIVGSELGATGYSRMSIASSTITRDDVNDRVNFDAADVTFTGIPGGWKVGCAVIYQQIGGDDLTPADDILVCHLDFTDVTTNGGDLVLQFSTNGVFYV